MALGYFNECNRCESRASLLGKAARFGEICAVCWVRDIEVPDAGARVVRARNSGKMEVRGRQAMADFTLARFCPHKSMAPVLAIMRLAAAAWKAAALTPLERVVH